MQDRERHGSLFSVTDTPAIGVPCLHGRHETLMKGEPIDLGDCVSLDLICTACAAVISEQSWTREAWLLKHRPAGKE